jgi:hypothetical protein
VRSVKRGNIGVGAMTFTGENFFRLNVLPQTR